jgi:nucleotide-binding universal stress UspA family protein
MRAGPIVIGFDGTPVSEQALHESAALCAERRALVVVVWEAGRAFEYAPLGASPVGLAPTTLDIRTVIETDRVRYESAQRLAEQGAALARSDGMEADGLAVADDVTVADTLVRVARELDAKAVVVGAHRRGRLSEMLLGSTSRDVLMLAPCPVVVVRGDSE